MQIINSLPDELYPKKPSVQVKNSLFPLTGYSNRDHFPKNDYLRTMNPVEISDYKFWIRTEYQQDAHSISFKSNWNKVLFGDEPKDGRSVLISQLNSYSLLPDDWDGYDGVAPNRQTVDDAIRLLHLLPNHISIPKPTLGNSGTVGFYWEQENLYAEVCFEGDETFWYYAKDTDKELGEDVVSLNTNTLPDELILFLERF